MYARDDTPLPPILTDGSWTVPFEFFGADTSHPLDQTGNTFDLTFAPKGRSQPAASDVHVLSSASGAITIVSNVVTVSNAVWTGWNPSVYQVELRQTNLANPDPIYVGTVTVAQGLSEVASAGGGSVIPGTPGAAVQLYYGTSSVQIVRGEASESALQAAASAAAAATSATNAASSATSASSSASAASTSATNAASSASSASTSATNAAASASAAATSETNAASDASAAHADRLAADTDASNAAASASAASTSATNAANSATAAANSDTDAQTQATNAAASASSASSSASTATTQATNAATSATNASNSANAAASSAAGANQNDTTGAAAILERVALNDPNATLAQSAATVNRGVENRPAASSGSAYFRIGLLASSNLTAVASFTRATTATGTDQSGNVFSVASGAPRVSTAGYLSEQASTNNVLWSRDLTNVVWVKTGCTAALDQTDAAGNANACSSLTAMAANATCLQAITLASAQRTQAVDVKRITGSGVVNMTMDGGTTWTALTLTTSWQRLSIPAQTLANPNVGFQLTTSGDKIAVDYVQNEAGSFNTSRMPTTTATFTRNADVATETVNIPVGQAFTVTGKLIAPSTAAQSASFPTVCDLSDGQGTPANYLRPFCVGSQLNIAYASNGISAAGVAVPFAITPDAPVGFAIAVSGSTVTWSVNGAAANTFTMSGGALAAALTKLALGTTYAGTLQFNSTIRELNVYMRAFSTTDLQTASDVSLERFYDFTTQTYQYIGEPYTSITELPGTTFSRATSATYVTLSGYVLNVASGAIRVGDAGLTIEPASTNLLLQSGTLGNASWSKDTGITINSTTEAAPDGTSTATEFQTDGGDRAVLQSVAVTATNTYTASIYARRKNPTDSPVLTIQVATTPSSTTVQSASISLTDTWTRYTFSFTVPAGDTTASVRFRSWTTPANVPYQYFGAQLEQLSYATGYMPTTSATFTRNADVLTTVETAPSAFSILAKFTIPATGPTAPHVFSWDDGTPNNVIELYYDRSAGHFYIYITAAGVSTSMDLGVATAGQTYTIATAFNTNDLAASVNGAACVTKTSGVTIPSVTTFRHFRRQDNSNYWGSGIQQIKRWRGRRTNAQLQADAT